MLNGEHVKKAIATFGKEIVEEVITQVNWKNDDVQIVREIYDDLKQYDYVDCVDFLYKDFLDKPSIQIERDIEFVNL